LQSDLVPTLRPPQPAEQGANRLSVRSAHDTSRRPPAVPTSSLIESAADIPSCARQEGTEYRPERIALRLYLRVRRRTAQRPSD